MRPTYYKSSHLIRSLLQPILISRAFSLETNLCSRIWEKPLEPGPMMIYQLRKLFHCFSIICSTVQYRKWSPTVNDPETANDPQNGPQMILDRKWSLKSTANDPVETWGMEWILWDWLQKRTDYKKETFFSRLLKKKGGRTLHLRSIYTRRKKKWNKSKKVCY